jgi:hypothetical protein
VDKVNWDATIDVHNNKIGMRVKVQDAKGFVLATMCTLVSLVSNPAVVEAMAARKASIFCRELRIQLIYLVGDALEILLALRQEEFS